LGSVKRVIVWPKMMKKFDCIILQRTELIFASNNLEVACLLLNFYLPKTIKISLRNSIIQVYLQVKGDIYDTL